MEPPSEHDLVTTIVICQGKPSCSLKGEEAVRAQLAGCPFCRRETWQRGQCLGVTEPSRA